jgi:hypothetical protein
MLPPGLFPKGATKNMLTSLCFRCKLFHALLFRIQEITQEVLGRTNSPTFPTSGSSSPLSIIGTVPRACDVLGLMKKLEGENRNKEMENRNI